MAGYSWHEEFFKKKVLPGLLQEMLPCVGVDACGFYSWLQAQERALHDEIMQLQNRIEEIWIKQGDREAFKATCVEWVKAHLRGKQKYLSALGLLPEPAPAPTGPAQGRLAV